jgi:hypothetical protein
MLRSPCWRGAGREDCPDGQYYDMSDGASIPLLAGRGSRACRAASARARRVWLRSPCWRGAGREFVNADGIAIAHFKLRSPCWRGAGRETKSKSHANQLVVMLRSPCWRGAGRENPVLFALLSATFLLRSPCWRGAGREYARDLHQRPDRLASIPLLAGRGSRAERQPSHQQADRRRFDPLAGGARVERCQLCDKSLRDVTLRSPCWRGAGREGFAQRLPWRTPF